MNIITRLKQTTIEQRYAWIIGISLITFVIHNPNQPFLDTKALFLPWISLLLILFFSIDYLFKMIKAKEKIELGSKWIWIPLVIITVSIIAQLNIQNIVVALGFFTLYIISRKLGDEIFRVFLVALIIASISTIYGYFTEQGKNGGIISPGNYDMATGFLVFSFLVSSIKHRWWLSAIAIIGLFFTGADEAIFVCVIVAIFVLIRRDFSKKLILPVATLIVLLAICTPLGITQTLYFPAAQKIAAVKEVVEETPIARAVDKIIPDTVTDKIESAKPDITEYKTDDKSAYLDKATGLRWLDYWNLSPLKPVGYGFDMWHFYKGIPHNVPMIIIEQIGIVGALAWCVVVAYCLVKTKQKYAWIGFVALGIFDHFTWTMAAPWFWVLAGVSSSSNINTDYIFKGE